MGDPSPVPDSERNSKELIHSPDPSFKSSNQVIKTRELSVLTYD